MYKHSHKSTCVSSFGCQQHGNHSTEKHKQDGSSLDMLVEEVSQTWPYLHHSCASLLRVATRHPLASNETLSTVYHFNCVHQLSLEVYSHCIWNKQEWFWQNSSKRRGAVVLSNQNYTILIHKRKGTFPRVFHEHALQSNNGTSYYLYWWCFRDEAYQSALCGWYWRERGGEGPIFWQAVPD